MIWYQRIYVINQNNALEKIKLRPGNTLVSHELLRVPRKQTSTGIQEPRNLGKFCKLASKPIKSCRKPNLVKLCFDMSLRWAKWTHVKANLHQTCLLEECGLKNYIFFLKRLSFCQGASPLIFLGYLFFILWKSMFFKLFSCNRKLMFKLWNGISCGLWPSQRAGQVFVFW